MKNVNLEVICNYSCACNKRAPFRIRACSERTQTNEVRALFLRCALSGTTELHSSPYHVITMTTRSKQTKQSFH